MRWNEFFGPGNRIGWATMHADAMAALAPFRNLVESGAPVAALPRILPGGAHLRWYIGWRDARDERFAVDLIRAYLGRTYAAMVNVPRPLIMGDPVEDAFREEFGERAFGLDVSYAHREEIRGRLQMMAHCLLARPLRVGHRFRPVGRVLRDAEFALQNGDGDSVSACIAELRTGGHLDATNLLYLEIRLLAARRDWSGIVNHVDLSRLLATAPPRRVREAIIQAAYHGILIASVAQISTDELIARFTREVMPRFGPVFGSRQGLAGLEVDACFVLLAAARGRRGDPEVVEGLERLAGMGLGGLVFDSASPVGGATISEEAIPEAVAHVTIDPLERARACFAECDLDEAFRAAAAAPQSRDRAQLLVHCATVLDSDDPALEAMIAWEALTDEDKASLASRVLFRSQLSRLNDRLGAPNEVSALPTIGLGPERGMAVTSWETWFSRLRDSRPWPAATTAASVGQRDWPVAVVANDEYVLSGIVETLEATLPGWSHEALRCSLPFLQSAFVTHPPDPRLATVVSALFDVLATDEALSVPACEALIGLGSARLALTHTIDNYRSTVEAMTDGVSRVQSPKVVALVLDSIEELIVAPCPDVNIRASAVSRLVSVAERWWIRVEAGEAAALRQFLRELQLPDELPSAQIADESDQKDKGGWSRIVGATIALYSLDEGALARAAAAILAACPTAKVRTFSEHVGTDAMREAARSSDLFVIATRSAKHAATMFIEANRRTQGDVRYSAGKGSTSIVKAVHSWVSEQK